MIPKKRLFIIFFVFSINYVVGLGQENNKIKTAVYLNFIKFSGDQISTTEFLSTIEDIENKKLTEREFNPFFQQMSLTPSCVKNITLNKVDSINLIHRGTMYEYQISSEFDCYKSFYNKLNLLCETKKILPDNQHYMSNGIIFPNIVFTKGLVFLDSSTGKLFFISGYLYKSKINEIYSTEEITKKQLSEIVWLRYSNYMPEDIIVVLNKKTKKIRFQSGYETLENVYFTVEYKNDFEIENFSFELKK